MSNDKSYHIPKCRSKFRCICTNDQWPDKINVTAATGRNIFCCFVLGFLSTITPSNLHLHRFCYQVSQVYVPIYSTFRIHIFSLAAKSLNYAVWVTIFMESKRMSTNIPIKINKIHFPLKTLFGWNEKVIFCQQSQFLEMIFDWKLKILTSFEKSPRLIRMI